MVTRYPRPRTGHANFSASGANEQIPNTWRVFGVGLGSPWSIALRVKQVALQGLGGPTQTVMLLGWDRRSLQGAGAALVDLSCPCQR